MIRTSSNTSRHVRQSAFSLIELLTVIFIISLLIAILLPSLNNARNQAKRTATSSLLRSIEAGLEMFKNDNGAEFGRTNGYPPSFSHPRIVDGDNNIIFDDKASTEGRSPFHDKNPVIYGAHFLPMMLLGADGQGFVQRQNVPKSKLDKPIEWYEPDLKTGELLPRQSLYLNSSDLRLVNTPDIIGRMPQSNIYPGNIEELNTIPVIVDSFDQPVLYYAANRGGSTRNIVEQDHKQDHKYDDGPPVYFHRDNDLFTGTGSGNTKITEGWDLGSGGVHKITFTGEKLTSKDIDDEKNHDTFARYIHDENAHRPSNNALKDNAPLRAVNSQSYLLITAGPDALFGTPDDVTNLPVRQ